MTVLSNENKNEQNHNQVQYKYKYHLDLLSATMNKYDLEEACCSDLFLCQTTKCDLFFLGLMNFDKTESHSQSAESRIENEQRLQEEDPDYQKSPRAYYLTKAERARTFMVK